MKKFIKNFKAHIKTDQNNIKFKDSEIEKYKLHQYKSPILINNIDIKKKLVSNKVTFGKNDFKCFIVYNDVKNVRLLCIFYPKMSAYRRD